MTIVKIDVPGWEHFNGDLGTVEFKNGVSTRSLTKHEIARLGANIRIVEVNGDKQVGPATSMVNSRYVSAHIEVPLTKESDIEAEEDTTPKGAYTEDSLTEIADKGGIKALRAVATEFGVKGVSISEMIAAILDAQNKKA